MIRRSVLLALGAVALAGLSTTASADTSPLDGLTTGSGGQHSICIGAAENNKAPLHGVCIWLPTN